MIQTKPNPCIDYTEALNRIEATRHQDRDEAVREICLPRVVAHGAQVEWAAVILHGFSTCPEQFHELSNRLFELGFNVYIPRQPYHGLSNRVGNNLAPLSAEELADYGDQSVDIGRGLGRRVLVIGLSGGGTVAAWLAQNRPDLDIAMPIAAMLGMSFIPSLLTRPFAWLFNRIPDFYMWWDPRNKAENPYAVDYSYPGYSIHSMSEVLKLGVLVRKQARTSPPAARKIVMVINDKEPGVNNKELYKAMTDWEAHNSRSILRIFHLEASLKLPHDIITPGTPGLDIETVYKLLIACILDETAGAT
jgi:pimeloyl-ACP methyl ester carboxylesterase